MKSVRHIEDLKMWTQPWMAGLYGLTNTKSSYCDVRNTKIHDLDADAIFQWCIVRQPFSDNSHEIYIYKDE